MVIQQVCVRNSLFINWKFDKYLLHERIIKQLLTYKYFEKYTMLHIALEIKLFSIKIKNINIYENDFLPKKSW